MDIIGGQRGGQSRRRRRQVGAVLAAVMVLAPAAVLAQTEPLAFVTASLEAGVKGEPYEAGEPPAPVILQSTGGLLPYSYRLLAGELPPGLNLATDGVLAGTPSRCGTYVLQVQVQDATAAFSNRTFVLLVGGVPAVVAPAGLAVSVEAGEVEELLLDLTNDGCESYSFHSETQDLGPVLPPSTATAVSGRLARLLAMGAPVPATLGFREEKRRAPAEGWSLDGAGRLLDAEGNVTGGGFETLRRGTAAAGVAGLTVLYINESGIAGERERIEATGCTVLQALVPQALDLATLRAFDLVWLTAGTDSIFPSRDAVLQYLWEGGGLVVTQVQVGGDVPLLPPGYALAALPAVPAGNNSNLSFTAEAPADPLTSTLEILDLPSNFDTTFIDESGPRWTWLATQIDQPLLGTLATAVLGAGRLVYHSGNLGTGIVPGARAGSEAFINQVVSSASSGGSFDSCPWLLPQGARSDRRSQFPLVEDVQSFDDTGETVAVDLELDATLLAPGDYNCEIALLTDDDASLEVRVPVSLTVTAPAEPRILLRRLPRAEPDQPYGAALLSAGGTPPYIYTQVGGSIPMGMNLNSMTGNLFGTPTEAGLFEPVFRITDATMAFTESQLPLVSGFNITTTSLPDALLGEVYTTPILAEGGTPPYRFEVAPAVDFALPATDPMSTAGQACVTTDLGMGQQSTTCDLPAGTYRVFFDPLVGFISPLTVDVSVPAGGGATLAGDYLQVGTISVTTSIPEGFYSVRGITPQTTEVQLDGTGDLDFVDVPPGDYTISFGAVLGFATPVDQSETLAEGGALAFDGVYISVTPPLPAAARHSALAAAVGTPGTDEAALSEIGFGSGTLNITTDAAGASFRIIGQRLPSFMELFEPCSGPTPQECIGEVGRAAALVGAMATLDPPTLVSGQAVPLAIIATDAAGNRSRQAYAPRVWARPLLTGLTPASMTQGLEVEMRVFGGSLRDTASLSFGPDIVVEVTDVGIIGTGGLSLQAVVAVDAAAEASDRDLIYVDPDLSGTEIGSISRLPLALQVFPELSTMDLDGSGRLDGFDLARVARFFGSSQGQPGFDPVADLDRSGSVDGDDLVSLAISFGRSTLAFDAAALPPAPATFGEVYEHRLPFIGGNLFLAARQLQGALPDGLFLSLEVGSDPPNDTELVISGIAAEIGTFMLQVQVVDAFFALAETTLVVTVDPPPAP